MGAKQYVFGNSERPKMGRGADTTEAGSKGGPPKGVVLYREALPKNLHLRKTHHTKLPRHLIALHGLQNNDKIIILPANKNIGVCILDKHHYIEKALSHLTDPSTYKPVPYLPFEELYTQLQTIVNQYQTILSPIEKSFILHKHMHAFKIPHI